MNQKQRLLEALKTRQINPLEAWVDLGIYRLSAIVFELKRHGHNIVTHRLEVKNRFDEVVTIASYELVE
jgi:hypothetical protein